MLLNTFPDRSYSMDSDDDDFVHSKLLKVKRPRTSKSKEGCDTTISTESTKSSNNRVNKNKNKISKLRRRSAQREHQIEEKCSRKSVKSSNQPSCDVLLQGIPTPSNLASNLVMPKSEEPKGSDSESQTLAPKLSVSVSDPLKAASTKLSDTSCESKQPATFEKHNQNGSGKADAAADVDRCPFCQMPFQALVGQSPNWHTMECMDIPLITTEECPAGLGCESTIPSHYRCYAHSSLAFHIAGQQHYRHDNMNHENMSQTKLGSQSPLNKIAGALQQSQNAKTPRKQQKSKLVSSKSKRKSSGSESDLSQSQGSQKDSSIKMYFSPSGKSSSMPLKRLKKCSTVEEEELDPVLRLLISDSESEEDKTTESKHEEEDCDTDSDTPEDKMLGNGKAESHISFICKDKMKVNVDSEDGLGQGQKFDEDDSTSKTVKEDGGFLEESAHEDPALSDQKESNSDGIGTSCSGHSVFESHQNFSDRKPSSACYQVPLENTFSMQKQTSLFSFFKPHCHSVNKKDRQLIVNSKSGSKPTLLKKDLKISNIEGNVETKPTLAKSSSEPVSLLKIPSPPPSVALKKRGSLANISRRQNGRQRPCSATDAASNDITTGWRAFRRQCPFYKKLTGTTITVDAFNYGEIPGCQAYVLTHFHYDHYQGLGKKFEQPIYCSSVTANLVEKQLGVASCWINRLPLNIPSKVAGVWLTLMEANHCPGAVIILFELPCGKKLLHTGDFRADPCMEQYLPLINVTVDELYLDTTYCDPSHAFPSQKETIEFAISLALKAKEREPRTLVACGSYTIGKERIFIALADALQSKICVQAAKKRVLDCLEDNSLKNRLSLKWADGCVHVLPMRQLNARGLEEHLQLCPQFASVLAFEPTGWTHNKAVSLDTLRPKFSRHGVTLYGVPYSEHSSFLEMKRFVQFLRPKKILPTVNNGNPTSRKKMEVIFKQWLSEGSTGNVITASKNCTSTQQQSLGTWLKK